MILCIFPVSVVRLELLGTPEGLCSVQTATGKRLRTDRWEGRRGRGMDVSCTGLPHRPDFVGTPRIEVYLWGGLSKITAVLSGDLPCTKSRRLTLQYGGREYCAGSTRLELATSCVTGRRSNQTELRPLAKTSISFCFRCSRDTQRYDLIPKCVRHVAYLWHQKLRQTCSRERSTTIKIYELAP